MSKFCTNCGLETDDNAVFCPECGTSFEQPEKQPQLAQPVEQLQQNPYVRHAQQPTQPTPPPQPALTHQNYYQPYQQQPYGETPYYYSQPANSAVHPAAPAKKQGKGFGIASLVLGILAFVNGLLLLLLDFTSRTAYDYDVQNGALATLGYKIIIITLVVFAGICALLSLTFGIISVVKCRRGTAITGLIMATISLIICAFSLIVVANLKQPTTTNNFLDSFYFDDPDFGNNYDDFEKYFIN